MPRKEAERKARALRVAVDAGGNPALDKARKREPKPVVEADAKPKAAPDTFGAATELFLTRYVATHQNPKTAYDTERLLSTLVLPHWSEKKLDEIRRPNVHALLDGIVDTGAKVRANRALTVLKCLWRFSISRGLTEFSPVQMLEKPTREVARDRVLSDAELIKILDAADDYGWPYGNIVALLAATGMRRTEIAGLKWSEVDLQAGLIAIPSNRRKGGIAAHTIPISSLVRTIIEGLPRHSSDRVFASHGKDGYYAGFGQAKPRLDKRCGVRNWRLHDLRRTMATKMQALGIKSEVVEACLGHTRQGIVAVYQRHNFLPEMAVAFEAWGKYLDALRHPQRPSMSSACAR
jgi:integrase